MTKLSVAQGWLSTWKRREAYRLKKYRFYRDKSKHKNRVELRKKWWRLLDESRKKITYWEEEVVKRSKPTPRQEAIKWAAAQVGVHEVPAGSNKGGKITAWQKAFGDWLVGEPWCGVFGGTALKIAGVKNVTARIASVALIEEDAKAKRGPFRGWTTDGSAALPGDLVVIGGYGIHVEVVEKVYEDGSVDTYGGNTSSGNGSYNNGGEVAHRHASTRRPRSMVRGFALVDYPNA